MTQYVEKETRGAISVITLNRPRAYNAFDLEGITELNRAMAETSQDPQVRAVVITGRGKAFCAGGDLHWARGCGREIGEAFHLLAQQYHNAVLEIRRMPKPVTAAINGAAAGGGFSLALACDFRIMAASAVLKQGYTSAGLGIDGGGTFALPRLVGLARALEIAAFDQPISAEKALEWGLVTRTVPDGRALEESLNMLRDWRGTSLHSFGVAKGQLIDSFGASLEAQLERERRGLAECARHPEGVEGLAAFTEKRPPNFGVEQG